NATVWRSPRRTALRGGRSRKAGKAKGQVDFRKPVVKSTSKDGLDPEVSLEVRPIVEVTLVPQKAKFHADVPLHLSGPPSITSRLELLTTMIKVTVVGPENVIQAIRDDASNLLYAFVVVQIPEAQLEAEKQFPLTQIHCVIRESRYAGEVQVIPMSDIRNPDNREVIVKVMK
ncbi:MAG: hypothetical protein QF645_08405, partial [Planctomycetota bacterium]|nr:hypothetical protein [Planctomycetota bacterium]